MPNPESSPLRLLKPTQSTSRMQHASPALTVWCPFVALADPARRVMTDFKHQQPIAVTEDRPIDEAMNDMIRLGVRALLVVRAELVSGLITSYDIQGERPLQFLRNSTFTRHDEIQVGHIMSPWDDVPTMEWGTVERALVGDILEIFRGTGTTHLVVVETVQTHSTFVRGLISRTRLERQLDARRAPLVCS